MYKFAIFHTHIRETSQLCMPYHHTGIQNHIVATTELVGFFSLSHVVDLLGVLGPIRIMVRSFKQSALLKGAETKKAKLLHGYPVLLEQREVGVFENEL